MEAHLQKWLRTHPRRYKKCRRPEQSVVDDNLPGALLCESYARDYVSGRGRMVEVVSQAPHDEMIGGGNRMMKGEVLLHDKRQAGIRSGEISLIADEIIEEYQNSGVIRGHSLADGIRSGDELGQLAEIALLLPALAV